MESKQHHPSPTTLWKPLLYIFTLQWGRGSCWMWRGWNWRWKRSTASIHMKPARTFLLRIILILFSVIQLSVPHPEFETPSIHMCSTHRCLWEWGGGQATWRMGVSTQVFLLSTTMVRYGDNLGLGEPFAPVQSLGANHQPYDSTKTSWDLVEIPDLPSSFSPPHWGWRGPIKCYIKVLIAVCPLISAIRVGVYTQPHTTEEERTFRGIGQECLKISFTADILFHIYLQLTDGM